VFDNMYFLNLSTNFING